MNVREKSYGKYDELRNEITVWEEEPDPVQPNSRLYGSLVHYLVRAKAVLPENASG